MNQKKPSKKQLEAKMEKALVFIPKGSKYLSASLKELGIVIESNDEFAVISRVYARNIYPKASVAYTYLRLLCQWVNKLETGDYDEETKAYVMENINKWLYIISDQDTKMENPYILRLCYDFFCARNLTVLSAPEKEKEKEDKFRFIDLYLETCKQVKLNAFIFKGGLDDELAVQLSEKIKMIEDEANANIISLVNEYTLINPTVFPEQPKMDDIYLGDGQE